MTVNVLKELLNKYDGNMKVKIKIVDPFAGYNASYDIEAEYAYDKDNTIVLCGIDG